MKLECVVHLSSQKHTCTVKGTRSLHAYLVEFQSTYWVWVTFPVTVAKLAVKAKVQSPRKHHLFVKENPGISEDHAVLSFPLPLPAKGCLYAEVSNMYFKHMR